MADRPWGSVVTYLALSLLLCSCSYHHLSPKQRGVNFPLSHCSETQLERAVEIAKHNPDAAFDESWVCVTKATSDDSEVTEKERTYNPAYNKKAKKLQENLETPLLTHTGRPVFGIALSGGGSKSAAFSVGVLSGLADLGLLDTADYISSVSGGGFAAYFYFSHRAHWLADDNPTGASTTDLFTDCISYPGTWVDRTLAERIMKDGGCPLGERKNFYHAWESADAVPPDDGSRQRSNFYQAFVRCKQDVFDPDKCSKAATQMDTGISFSALLETIGSVPFAGVANFLFDWGIGTSPAVETYRNGIGIAYGSSPGSHKFYKPLRNQSSFRISCDKNSPQYVTRCIENNYVVEPVALQFNELHHAYLRARTKRSPLPFWIINASSPPYRSTLGLIGVRDEQEKSQDIFEMTAVSHGSGRYGFVPTSPALHKMSTLDAVVAAGAFFDSNQQQYNSMVQRVGLGLLLQIFNMDWGTDISNYNVSDGRRYMHRLLPWPFYLVDGPLVRFLTNARASEELQNRSRVAFIRLTDGGNAEDLGAFSLIKRGVRNILVSDAANDSTGRFQDICDLRSRLKNGTPPEYPTNLYLPALGDLEQHCERIQDSQAPGFSVHDWPLTTPVLLGCITEAAKDGPKPCSELGKADIRLFVVKPAINRKWVQQQFEPTRNNSSAPRLKECWLPKNGSQSIQDRVSQPEDLYLLNCETAMHIHENWNSAMGTNDCPVFPQHGTASMTVNSSSSLFKAYRELARQYVVEIGAILSEVNSRNSSEKSSTDLYNKVIEHQEIYSGKISAACIKRPVQTVAVRRH